MVLLSRVLKYQFNRWVNIIVATINLAIVIGMGTQDLDDIFLTLMEVISLSVIIWYAWKWHKYSV